MSRRRRGALGWLALAGPALALALAGCASLEPHLVAPSVEISAVNFQGGSLERERLQLSAHVVNPNDRSIAVDSMTAAVDLDGTPFAMGVTDAAFVLPANGAFDVLLDVTANMGSALVALAARATHGQLHYRIYGQVRLQRGLVRSLHYSHQGEVRL
jgi:LEA14-like dessication related protein